MEATTTPTSPRTPVTLAGPHLLRKGDLVLRDNCNSWLVDGKSKTTFRESFMVRRADGKCIVLRAGFSVQVLRTSK